MILKFALGGQVCCFVRILALCTRFRAVESPAKRTLTSSITERFVMPDLATENKSRRDTIRRLGEEAVIASRSTRGGKMRRAFLLLGLTGVLSFIATGVASAQEPAMCLDVPATVTGSGTIVGTNGPDVIVGSTGNDTILGLGGDDLICGDLGNDSIVGGEGNDLLIGDSSLSLILGQNGGMSVPGGNDEISGGNGDDEILGEAGNDVIDGGNGDDFGTGNVGTDVVSGGTGDDELFGGPGDDTLNGENGNDFLIGTFGSDVLNGGRGDDLLDGDLPPMDESGEPVIDPNPNSDTCNGDQGFDIAFGCETISSIESIFGS